MSDTPTPELNARMQLLFRAIDDVLVANHTLRASLAEGHLSLIASLAEGVARYGDNPAVLALWLECRAVDTLRLALTGKRGVDAPVTAVVT